MTTFFKDAGKDKWKTLYMTFFVLSLSIPGFAASLNSLDHTIRNGSGSDLLQPNHQLLLYQIATDGFYVG